MASPALGPEKVIESLVGFLKEKFSEHYHAQIKITSELPIGSGSGNLLMLPIEVRENIDLYNHQKTYKTETSKSGEEIEHMINPKLHFDMKLLFAFDGNQYLKNALGIMQLTQIFKEYGLFKVDDQPFEFKVMPEMPLGEKLEFWKNLGLSFRPSLTCRLGLIMEPIRSWKYKKVKERIVHSNIKEV